MMGVKVVEPIGIHAEEIMADMASNGFNAV